MSFFSDFWRKLLNMLRKQKLKSFWKRKDTRTDNWSQNILKKLWEKLWCWILYIIRRRPSWNMLTEKLRNDVGCTDKYPGITLILLWLLWYYSDYFDTTLITLILLWRNASTSQNQHGGWVVTNDLVSQLHGKLKYVSQNIS